MGKKQSLTTNAILNMLRRACAILFPIVTFSYASHKLGAAGIGVYSFCNSVVSYFLLLAALGISTYAVREGQAVRDDKREFELFVSEVYTINILTTVISYVLLGLLFLVWTKLHGYREMLFLLSLSIVITTVGADWINTLLEDYYYITIRYIGIQVFCLIALVILIKGPDDIYKYALITVMANAGGTLLNVWYIRKKVSVHLTRHPNFKKHLIPMLTLFSNSLAIQIYLIADITILGIYMSDQFVGYYTLSSRVYTAIKEMLNAMILVTVPRFSYYISHGENQKYKESFNDVCIAVITLMFPCIVGLLFQAKNIAVILGGHEYINSTASLRILSIAMFFAVGACLVAQSVLIPNKKENIFLMATIISAALNIALNFLLIPKLGIEAAAFTTLISESSVFLIMTCRGRQAFPPIMMSIRDIMSAIIGSAGIAVVCIIVNTRIDNMIWNMLISIALSVVVYFVITYTMHNKTVYKTVSWVLQKRIESRDSI